jgi:UDP-N-acetyl-2-amino-2-deoxyglucuronate dehydrogenase
MDSEIGFAIVGCGTIADMHAAALKEIPETRLMIVYSRNHENAKKLGSKYNVKWTSNWDELKNNTEVDIVSICTPSGTHLDYGSLVAESGKHVIVEKPIEVTPEKGQLLIEICRKKGIKLAVIYQNRFLPDVKLLKNRILSNQLGNLFLADAYIKWYRSQEYYDSADWRGTLALDGGGVLINQAIHTIDLLQWLVGKVESVSAYTGTYTHKNIEGEDTAVAALKFSNGALGVIEASTSVKPAMERRIEIHGEKGSAIIKGENLIFWDDGTSGSKIDLKVEKENTTGSSAPMQNFSLLAHKNQFLAILDALRNNEQPPVSGEESLHSLAVVAAIYESAQKGTPVVLKYYNA